LGVRKDFGDYNRVKRFIKSNIYSYKEMPAGYEVIDELKGNNKSRKFFYVS